MNTINTKQVLSLIGALAGEPVQLHQARLMDGQQAFAIVPTAPGRLHLPLWRNVRMAPSGGVWLSPEAAIVGFTHLIAQIAKQVGRPTQETIRRRVMTLRSTPSPGATRSSSPVTPARRWPTTCRRWFTTCCP